MRTLFAIRFDLEEKTNTCSLSDLKQELSIEDKRKYNKKKKKKKKRNCKTVIKLYN